MRWLAPTGPAPTGTAAGSSIVVVSPPVAASSLMAISSLAASSPVDVGSEAPMLIPTPSFGSEGSVPPMPPGGRTLDTNDPNSVWMAQNVIDVFAEEVKALAQNSPDFCDVSVDGFHDGMTVWWHGTPTSAVLDALVRARHAGIMPVVSPTAVERATLDAAVDRLSNRTQELGITGLGRSADCSGLDVGLIIATLQVEARVAVAAGPGIPLHFSETGPVSPA